MKILNVAEKNDAAKSLAEIMSGGHFRRVSKTGQIVLHKLASCTYQSTCASTNNSGDERIPVKGMGGGGGSSSNSNSGTGRCFLYAMSIGLHHR